VKAPFLALLIAGVFQILCLAFSDLAILMDELRCLSQETKTSPTLQRAWLGEPA